MRKDISKLVTERERGGRAYAITKKYGGRVPVSKFEDDDYQKEKGGFHSSSRHRQKNCKHLSDHLSPLWGILRKNVGRPWDKVYSEFCQLLDKRSISGEHIFNGHLMREVERNTFLAEDGKTVMRYETYRWLDRGHEIPVDGYYVHPKTGLLCYKKRESFKNRYRDAARKAEIIEIPCNDPTMVYKKENDLWYRITTTKTVVETLHDSSRYSEDYVAEAIAKGMTRETKTGVKIVRVGENIDVQKKSCNKKELAMINDYIKKHRV
jgi:hypothetical protein